MRHLSCQRGQQLHQLGGGKIRPRCERYQLLELPQQHAALGLTTPPHVPVTGVQCSSCHVNTATSFVTYTMNHAAVGASRCDSCHNGSYTSEGTKGAQGTASYAGHVATTGRDCVTCHASAATTFTSWAGGVYAHQPSDTNCSSCHNGTTATGNTTPPHIPVDRRPVQQLPHQYGGELHQLHDEPFGGEREPLRRLPQRLLHRRRHQGRAGNGLVCRPCGDERPGLHHLPRQRGHGFTSWAGGVYAHPPSDTNCSSCHNGTTATGKTTPPHIPVDRRPVQQLPHQHGGELRHLHDEPLGGQRAAAATPATTARTRAKAPRARRERRRIRATSQRAAATASPATPARPPASQAGPAATYVHQATDTNCTNCHNGTTATGMTTPPHIPTGVVQCSNCHINTAASFVTYTMNHSAVSGSRCDSCHNGSYTAEGTKGAQGTASYPGHVATNGRDCVTCHASAAATYTSWAGGIYVHQPTDTNCSSCHNGTTATGMTTPPHVPIAGVQCSNCHTNTAASFVTYTMNHSAVSASRCNSCHNGSYTGEGTKGAQGTASYPGPRRHRRPRLRHLSRRAARLLELGGRHLRPSGRRHKLLELPQRHDGARHDDAAAYPDDFDPVQQLPHQYGGELHHLHDEPRGGERERAATPATTGPTPREGTQGRAGHRVVCRAMCRRMVRTASPATPGGHGYTSWVGGDLCPCGDRHQLLDCHNGTTATGNHYAAAHPDRPASSAAIATPIRRRASPPTR